MKYKNPREISPVEVCFSLVDGKFKATIIWYLSQKEPRRYSELSKCLPRNNPKVFTQQLRAMENDGLIVRTVYPEVPPRVEYSLTELGRSLYPVIQQAHLWAINYVRNLPAAESPITDKARKCYDP